MRIPALPHPTPTVRDALLGASALAVLTLPDPTRVGPAGRHVLRLGSAAVAAWAGSRVAQDDGMPFVPSSVFGAAAGAAVSLALAPVEDATDRWLVARLRRAGLRNPRPLMAVLAAGLGALAWAGDGGRRADGGLVEVDHLYHERELDPALRDLLGAMLRAGDPSAADVALAQLKAARAEALGEGFESTVMLVVDDDVPRVVPHTQAWPVRARWHIDGHPVELTLQVHEGRLDHLALMPVEGDYPEDVDPFEVSPVDDPSNVWPEPRAVSLIEETAEGVRPVPVGRDS